MPGTPSLPSMASPTERRESIATIRTALHQRINLIDTVPVYGFGVSEEIVGQALQGVSVQASNEDGVIFCEAHGL